MTVTLQQAELAMLAAARWLAANPDRHIGHVAARDKGGHQVPPTDPDAYCFCGVGRFAREVGLTHMSKVDTVLRKHFRVTAGQLMAMNDSYLRDKGLNAKAEIVRYMRSVVHTNPGRSGQ